MALQPRPPVVTIMGHVDHGKTSLLDYIRQAKVAAGEAGGITQHIGAYQAQHDGKTITFLDTPGHAAFSKMRSRGANITDLAVLVVAADDGVMPQTVESIKYIHNAKVPMIVAVNKIDLPGVNAETVKAQLTEHGVYVTGYGGDVEVVELSAKTGQGVDTLLETILMLGEILELQADPAASFQGVVIESSKDKFRGSLATVLVKQGSLHVRDPLYTSDVEGSVRTMTDALGKQLTVITPGMPAEITGFNAVPEVGSVVTTMKPEEVVAESKPMVLDFAAMLAGESDAPKLRLIVKADYAGSLEAVLGSIENEHIEVIHTGIGDVSESDIQLAETSKSMIITFQTKVSGAMKKLADRSGVKVKTYRIIYELIEDIERAVYLLLHPGEAEEKLGTAEVLQIFNIRGDLILGCRITERVVRKGELVHIQRQGQSIADGQITSLKQGKTDIDSASEGDECGIVVKFKSGGKEPLVGDILQSYKIASS